MTNFTKHTTLGLTLLLLVFAITTGQSATLIKDKSSVTITGTSSLHDWHENVGDFTINLSITKNNGPAPSIGKATFTVRSSSVTSDSKLMTDKTMDALQAKKYPEITFVSNGSSSVVVKEGTFTGNITGDLVLNGVTKRLSVPVNGSYADDKLAISGSQKLKMSDYQIKSPTAMLGTLKTGDEVTVHFDLKFDISDSNQHTQLLKTENKN